MSFLNVKKWCNQIIVAVFFSIAFTVVHATAESTSPPIANQYKNEFKLSVFQAELVRIKTMMLQKPLNYSIIFSAIHAADNLKKQLQNCVNADKSRLNTIDNLIKNVGISAAFQEGSVPYEYLKKEKHAIVIQKAYCEFYAYQLNEIDGYIHAKLKNVNFSDTLKKSPSFVKQLNTKVFSNLTFNTEKFYQLSSIFEFDKFLLGGLVLILLCSAVFVIYVRYIFKKQSKKVKSHNMNLLFKTLRTDIIYLVPLFFIYFYLYLIIDWFHLEPMILYIMHAVCIYALMVALLRLGLIFALKGNLPIKNAKALNIYHAIFFIAIYVQFTLVIIVRAATSEIPLSLISLKFNLIFFITMRCYIAIEKISVHAHANEILMRLYKRACVVGGFVLLYIIVPFIFQEQKVPYPVIGLTHAIYLTLFNLMFLWLIWLIFQIPYLKNKVSTTLKFFIKLCLWSLCFIGIALGWVGYNYIAMAFLPMIIISMIFIRVFFEQSRFLGWLYNVVNDPSFAISKKIHFYLGIKPGVRLVEFYILRLTLNLVPMIVTAFGLIEIWGGSVYRVAVHIGSIQQGITILGLTMYPGAMLRAINLFCLIILFGRLVTTFIINNARLVEDKHMQVTLRSLLQYIIFTIAVLISLYIAGVSLSGLIVIAGALSVGIGFGLQNFASDFISGLFVMFNKPVKIGDHVIVDGTEGFIKKIGTLSTQVTTMSRSDVIIPNSKLISNSVTNFTFHNNKLCRLTLKVRIKNIADVEKAEKILIDSAITNPDIINTPPNQPVVLFEMDHLELAFFMRDVERKAAILSALNLLVIREFNKNNIELN